jgi:hypothetical protein
MAIQISPGVSVSEADLTTVASSVLTTTGAFAGAFKWGPANKRTQISTESQLVQTFYKPDSNTYASFFTAASFLAYGNNLQVVRTLGTNHKNADGNTSATNIAIANEDSFENPGGTGSLLYNTTNGNAYGSFMARYPGALGNSLTVSVVDAAVTPTQFGTWNVNGIGVSSYFSGLPGTSAQASSAGASNDEIHVIVVDTGGLFTGIQNTVLEVFPYLSKASDAKDSLGNSNYYKNYIFRNSKYVYALDPVSYTTTYTTWGQPLANTNYNLISIPTTNNIAVVPLSGGADDTPNDAATTTGFSYFANKDEVDVSLILTGNTSITVQQSILDNVVNTANGRSDCLVFFSPPSTAVVNQAGNETTNIINWLLSLSRSSSYAVADSGWKYMFDKYNNTYRWIPLNGDIAGLCVYTDSVTAPWFSPAGFNRGNLKNVIKLAWNPTKSNRDTLYSNGVNPVGTFPGQGTVLFGDKTLLSKPSAFDRINVRRLFNVLEKTIARASQYSLFEFNDASTQNQFVSLVTPFLTDVKARRGIYDFKVVCDSTNNTPQVIDANQFVGDIYIKPARSVNFIQLNFVAVRTGVDFTTVVNAA